MSKITWRISDAGRVADGFDYESNDCLVRAFAWAMQKPYWAVHAYFECKLRRVTGYGLSPDEIRERAKGSFFYNTFNWWTCYGGTLNQFVKENPVGNFVVQVIPQKWGTGHAIGIVDGVIQDQEKLHGKCKVYVVWRVK